MGNSSEKKPVTLADLADMVGKGFLDMGTKLEDMDTKIDEVQDSLRVVEAKVTTKRSISNTSVWRNG